MKIKIVALILITMLASCGLKKPLADPDKDFPNEKDCECENPDSE